MVLLVLSLQNEPVLERFARAWSAPSDGQSQCIYVNKFQHFV